jgi:hypothetical protein
MALVVTSLVIAPTAMAQATKAAGKSDAVFDEEKKSDEKKAAEPKAPAVSDRDTIGFNQQNIAAQMNELEERMFRLSEALLGLEPENSSRLRLALKFSREEQILDQMRETHTLLKDAQLSKAETEVKELLAKLENLRTLLLAEDLDFQLKLARLRQMRETLGQLDRIVKEQRRELGWSRFAMDQRKRLERIAARRPDLEVLVRDQQTVIDDTRKTAGKKDKADENKDKDARAAIRVRESKLRTAATALANDPLFADLQPPYLRRAEAPLAEAVKGLDKTGTAAIAAEEQALGLLRDELKRLDEQVEQAKKTIAESEFRRRGEDQAKNRGAAERLDANSVRLGDVGIAIRKDLIRAGAIMRTAEQKLAKASVGPAADDQTATLEILGKSRDEFLQSIERLLVELRSELRSRLIGELTEMHELQSAIRETTQAQVPRVQKKSRTALITVAGLAKNEAEIADRTEHLLALVEETEYGIALPTTLRILSREMRSIEAWLKASDVAPRTTAFQTRIAEDVLGLAMAVRRLPSTTPPPAGTPLSADPREQERELNRMIAELKMVRMIQARLNDDTVGVDKARPASSSALSADLRREVETLEVTQDEIRDALAKIAERLPIPDDNAQ